MSQPLLDPSSLPFQAIPFDRIQDSDFQPAFDQALREARGRLEKLRTATAEPDFENTLVGLEACSERLDLVSAIYSNLLHARTNEKLQTMAGEILPRLAEFSNDVFLDEKVFSRVKEVHDRVAAKKTDELTVEQARLLEKTYRAFVRNGALLDPRGKERIRQIDQRLSVLTQRFSDHVLKATNAYELHLTSEEELAGLPESAREAAALAAKERGKRGWVVTLQYPSMGPFLQFSERRELREKIWKASMARATQGELDNRPLISEIVALRHERAQLLSYRTHAHFVLEERMAREPAQVNSFIDRLLETYRQAAEKDLGEVRKFSDLDQDLKPWDMAFWSERLKRSRFDLDEESLRPYFELESVISGVFEHARRLYGLDFKRRTDLPVYHPDVQVFEVTDSKDGRHIGLFYGDYFPRSSKRGGAWMTLFKDQGLYEGKIRRPHVSIVCNLTRPTETKPSLLTLNEVRTVFHEFGHALHGLLSDCTYRSLASPNVYWDFVELPSQVMENWVKEKQALDLFARHHETGEGMPEDLIARIRDSARFQAGWMALRQLNFATLDMAWHSIALTTVSDVEAYEKQATSKTSLFAPVAGAIASCSFSHIFAGGYSAGYYSYKWAEVLDADAFEYFQEKGIFSREVADRFRTLILEKGGTEHPMELYKRFRGREPDPSALLRREGLFEKR